MTSITKIEKAINVISNILNEKDFNSNVTMRLNTNSKFNLTNSFYIKLADYLVIFCNNNDIFLYRNKDVKTIRQFNKK